MLTELATQEMVRKPACARAAVAVEEIVHQDSNRNETEIRSAIMDPPTTATACFECST